MVSANKAGFYLRETRPLSHNILSTPGVVAGSDVGQRTNLEVVSLLKGYRILRVGAGYPTYPAPVRDSAKSGLGSRANRYLNYPVESDYANTGGTRRNAKESSLPMSVEGVGGVILLGAQESCVHGEGRQEFGTSTQSTEVAADSPYEEVHGRVKESVGEHRAAWRRFGPLFYMRRRRLRKGRWNDNP